MEFKSKIKMVIDIAMSVSIFMLMSLQFTGQKNHEIIGTIMLVLFILHNIMNYKWYLALRKGKYSIQRSFVVIVDILFLIDMVILMVSGIGMSRYVFRFLDINMSQSLARNLHMTASYTGFLLMGLHLGLHYGMIRGMFCKLFHIENKSKIRIIIFRGISYIISLYGIYALIKRNFISYITLQMHFVLVDFEESILSYELDLISITILMIVLGFNLQKIIIKMNKNKK